MFTILLAWINAKYESDYEFLFIGTIILDICLVNNLFSIFRG